MTRETQSQSSDLTNSTNVSRSLYRLSHHLRALLRSLAGENPDADRYNVDPDYDGSNLVDPAELLRLVEALDQKAGYAGTDGREDWAIEREYEITRLERENEELRRLLKIDPENLAASGVVVDPHSLDAERHLTIVNRASGEQWDRRPFRDGDGNGNGNGGQQPQQQQPQLQQQPQSLFQQQQQQGGGVLLQRPMEIPQPGMRIGNMQGRRPGMFGPAQRGGNGGRMAGPPPPPPSQSGMWSNQQPVPAPLPPRTWQPSQGGSGLDLSR